MINSDNCIDAEKLIQYKNYELHENEANTLKSHLSNCEQCRRNLKVMNRIDNILDAEGHAIKYSSQSYQPGSDCLSDELLYQYIEGNFRYDETKKIERHLNTCEWCLAEVASLVKNSFSPLTATEKLAIEELQRQTPEQQAELMVAYYKQLNEPAVKTLLEKMYSLFANFIDGIRKIMSQVFVGKSPLKPAFAGLMLIVCIIGFSQGIKYYNTGYQIKLAETLLKDNYKAFVKSARLSGGYATTGMSFLLSAKDDSFTYLEQAESMLKKAERMAAQSNKIRLLLARIFIIKRENSRADSIYALVEDTALNAALINDMGKLFFDREDYKNASIKFQSAMEFDPNLLEAQFNLGLAKIKMGKSEDANFILKEYIELEKNDEWKNIAQGLINDMNRVEGK